MVIYNNTFVRGFKSLLRVLIVHSCKLYCVTLCIFADISFPLSFCDEGIDRVYYQVILPVVTDGSNKTKKAHKRIINKLLDTLAINFEYCKL